MKLIDKDVLIAKIENIRKHYIERDDFDNGWNFALDKVLSFLYTIEVKEVDWYALGILAEHILACDAHGVSPKFSDGELDLLEELKNYKAQKGESV